MSWSPPRKVTTSLETLMGYYLDYDDPRPETICITDIARGLAHTCRYGGQTTRYFSVAEHALYVHDLVLENGGSDDEAYAALHHDSHEAYLCDWPSPLKVAIGQGVFDEIADKIDIAIGKALGIDHLLFKSDIVKKSDYQALLSEAATLKPSRGVGEHWNNFEPADPLPGAGLTPEFAERLFVQAHRTHAGMTNGRVLQRGDIR